MNHNDTRLKFCAINKKHLESLRFSSNPRIYELRQFRDLLP